MNPLDLSLLIFTFMLGACIGSFLNVVIYRLPAGESLIRPPSHCPHCNYRLAWYDNFPILGWCWLRGRCRKCKTPISIQYPLIELLTAVLFAGLYWVFYISRMRYDYYLVGVLLSWPAFIAYLFLLGGLLAATVIDARYFIIPLQIPWLITAAAVVLMPCAGYYERYSANVPQIDPGIADLWHWAVRETLPWAEGPWAFAAIGGVIGLVIANVLLAIRILPRSFNDIPEDNAPAQPDQPDVFPQHPHPRKEMLKECLFLLLPAAGVVIGYFVFGAALPVRGPLGVILHVLGGVLLGYLGGGAVVWATRLLGTFAFGKEAMGLGDVHLMAAVGAVAGWRTAVLAFFLAPFLGLSWALLSAGAQKLLKREVRMIPYGPHLAIASVVVVIFHQPLMERFGVLLAR